MQLERAPGKSIPEADDDARNPEIDSNRGATWL